MFEIVSLGKNVTLKVPKNMILMSAKLEAAFGEMIEDLNDYTLKFEELVVAVKKK